METVKTKQTFIELRAKGYSFDKIAGELGKSKQTLIDWSRELQDEIENFKAMEMEALYEAYYLHKINRLQTFGEILGKIRAEALSRDLSEVPTEKILELLIKYNAQLRDEITEPEYKSSTEIESEKKIRAFSVW